MARVSTGSKVVLAASVLLFISLFFPWQDVLPGEFEAFGVSGNISGFTGIGILVAILALATIAWEAMLLFGVNINMGTMSPALIGAILAGATALFAIIKFLTSLNGVAWGAFVGLILALALAYGAYMRFQESKVGPMAPPA